MSELDLDLGSRPDSGLGSSPGSVTDRVTGASSPGPMDHHAPATSHCGATLAPGGGGTTIIKSEIPEIMETARPDSSTTAGDENNNSSRPASAFSQVNPNGIQSEASTSQQNPNMLSVVQVIPSRLPDGQVVFLLPSHYVQLAAAAAANGISIGPNPPTAIWAATNMSLLKATDKLIVKRPHDEALGQDWGDGVKPSKSPRIDGNDVSEHEIDHVEQQHEQPLDFTTSKKIDGGNCSIQVSGSDDRTSSVDMASDVVPAVIHGDNGMDTNSNSSRDIRDNSRTNSDVIIRPDESPPPQPAKDEEGMWRPW